MSRASDTRTRVITCRGARAAERRLLAEIGRLAATAVEDLAQPVRVVVPSKSLRRHLLRVLARRRGALAGIQVQTLFGLALEVVARAGVAASAADAGFEVQVRRLAAGEAALRAGLDELADGYDAVVGAVRDLLDAGFLPGNEEGVLERLDEVAETVAPERVERARALVRLAVAAFEEAEAGGLRRSMRVLQLAEEALLAHGPELLPTRALFVHGFADVTGVSADLLLGLARVLGGMVLLDRPPDPAAPERDDLGGAYLSRLEERVAHFDQERDETVDPAPEIELAEAPDAESEARWVAERIRGLLDGGVEPETVGVIGRAVEAMALPLRRHFRRLGVPYSGEGTTVRGAGPRRKLNRLTEVLRRGSASEVDLWIEARAGRLGTTELLLGLRVLGIQRLADLAVLASDAAPSSGVPLPIALAPEDEAEADRHTPRRLPRDLLRRAVGEAKRLVAALEGRVAAAPASVHRRHTLGVLAALGWDEQTDERRAVHDALNGLCKEFPETFELTAAEWLKLLRDRLERVGEVPLGGAGAGVQVLTVMEARARTFARLFVVGMNRGVFPRVGHEDPMLPESVRARLAADVLPEMPVKGRGADEERYLFAQLLSSSPTIAVSWHVYGGEGTLTPSPFVDRLRRRAGVENPVSIAQLWAVDETVARPRTAYELAVIGASAAGAGGLAGLLEPALAEGLADADADPASVAAGVVAAARADVLAAVERPRDSTAPSPWFGFTGGGDGDGAEDEALWVTHAERTGTCPLRAFVERRLGVLPLPDPLLGLPGIGGSLVGQVVHGVLESVVLEAVDNRGELEAVIAREPVEVRWPDALRLDDLVAGEARRVAAREGLAPLGMAPLLAARARQFLEVERGLEWADGVLRGVLGTETEGWAAVPGVSPRLAFRADRVDADGEAVVLVDYKSAKPEVEAATEPTRGDNLRDKIARGRLLQAAAYSQAVGVRSGRGKYLYLKPGEDWAENVRELAVRRDDETFVGPFRDAVRCIVAARSLGVAFPRVEEANGRNADHCTYCGVAEACRRGDSAFRGDLVRWMGGADGAGDPAVDAARALWWLGFERPEGGG